jgi:hypothetical protein
MSPLRTRKKKEKYGKYNQHLKGRKYPFKPRKEIQ